MRPLKYYLILISIYVFSAACQRHYLPQHLTHSGYEIAQNVSADTTLYNMLKPYRDSLAHSMNDELGVLSEDLKKALPDGTLGNFIADAYLGMARTRYNKEAQMAFMNHGGIRLNSIPAGKIKRGTIYEVMPFDNQMVIMEVQGRILKNYLDIIAKDGGGGVAGIRFTIKDRKAVSIEIGGKPLEDEKMYIMVNSDYVVNGGGGFNGFRDLPQNRPGYLLRDAIIDYCLSFRNAGRDINISNEKRITK